MRRTVQLSPARRLVALKSLPGFSHLPPAQIVEMEAHARVLVFERGAMLHQAGLVPDQLHLVMSGKVACTRDMQPEWHVAPFELVGGMDVLTGDTVTFDAIAEERVVSLSLDLSVMRAILVDNFAIFMAVVADVARRILSLRARVSDGPAPTARANGDREVRADNMVAIIAALLEVPELAALPIDVLAVLASHARMEACAAGTLLWRRGEPCRHALLVLRGGIDCGSNHNRWPAGHRHLWGLEEALAGRTRAHDAVAIGDVTALVVEERILLDELEDDSTAALAFLQALIRLAASLDGYCRLRGAPA